MRVFMVKQRKIIRNTEHKIYSGSLNRCDWATSTFGAGKIFHYDQIGEIQLELENKLSIRENKYKELKGLATIFFFAKQK